MGFLVCFFYFSLSFLVFHLLSKSSSWIIMSRRKRKQLNYWLMFTRETNKLLNDCLSSDLSDVYVSCFVEIEAVEACRWLKEAGFPQYAQMYDGMYIYTGIANYSMWQLITYGTQFLKMESWRSLNCLPPPCSTWGYFTKPWVNTIKWMLAVGISCPD